MTENQTKSEKIRTLIPSNRLLLFFGAICFPFTILAVAVHTAVPVSYGIIGLFVVIAVADARMSGRVFDGIAIEFPDVIRMTKGRNADISLVIHNRDGSNGLLRIGLAFPCQINAHEKEQWIRLPEKEVAGKILWPISGLKMGQYFLGQYYREKSSPAGLWMRRESVAIKCEIRIYPNLYAEKHAISALFLDRGVGAHTRRLLGKGRDFEQLRDYMPGDSFEDVHWKATAKRGKPITKVYQVERTQDIYLMIDASRMSARNAEIFHKGHLRVEKRSSPTGEGGISQETILERYITAALAIGMMAQKQGDNFGLLVFSDQVQCIIKAKGGKAHYNACRDMLYSLEPRRVTPDFSELFTFIGSRIRKRALVIVLTSLDDPILAENFMKNVHIASRRHLVITNMLKPALAAPLFKSNDAETINDIYQYLCGHVLWNRLRELERSLRRYGIGFGLLDNEYMCMQLISQYTDIKQRQLI